MPYHNNKVISYNSEPSKIIHLLFKEKCAHHLHFDTLKFSPKYAHTQKINDVIYVQKSIFWWTHLTKRHFLHFCPSSYYSWSRFFLFSTHLTFSISFHLIKFQITLSLSCLARWQFLSLSLSLSLCYMLSFNQLLFWIYKTNSISFHLFVCIYTSL